jgi:hypothetical protein
VNCSFCASCIIAEHLQLVLIIDEFTAGHVCSTEDDADVRCKENLDLAIESDPSNAETFHTLASYWLSKDDKQVMNVWKRK